MRLRARWRGSPRLGVLAVLGTVNLMLGAKLSMLAFGDETVGLPRAAWEAALPRSVASLAGRPPVDAYAEITAHPVFYRSREPFVAPPPPPPRPLPAPVVASLVAADPGLMVGGVMIHGGVSKAYLQSKSGPGGGSWVTKNESYQGWQVKMIDPSGVRIEQAGRTIELQLYPRN
ncbi:exported hypothetical protein [Bradyrhizobium sp. ORS 375]|uniref:hypothetical protein n=1 Tax=Bradyrhizobium sp. (strain ORS 375) TaxID=566679 RepID=UPI0002407A6E|nr:hypothetical protein [Bradyrhizobium sp. ORS 375]CCD93737.1 exported hypothetical protein [Bradyrhizobium sp. ORS 375]